MSEQQINDLPPILSSRDHHGASSERARSDQHDLELSEIGLESREAREAARDDLKEMIYDLSACLNDEPARWANNLNSLLTSYQQGLSASSPDDPFDPIVREFISEYVDEMRQQFSNLSAHDELAATPLKRQRAIAIDLIEAVKQVSLRVDEDMALRRTPVTVQEISINDLIRLHNEKQQYDGSDRFILHRSAEDFHVYSVQQDRWFSFPIPKTPDAFHKGGFPRLMLKLHAGAPADLIEAELPPNDLDIIALQGSEGARREADRLKIELEGIEQVAELNFQILCATRDIDLNSCFVGQDKLVFSTDAFQAARSGVISVLESERGLFGAEFFIHDGVILTRNRGISRLMKFVAEGKASGFWFKGRNAQIEMGIHWNVLARKFESKSDAPRLFENLYELGVKGGQIDPKLYKNLYQIVDATHARYPFFDFDQGPQDPVGVARWIFQTKFCRQLEDFFKKQVRVHRPTSLEVTEGDDVPFVIQLSEKAVNHTPPSMEEHRKRWSDLMSRCRARTAQFREGDTPLKALQREVRANHENGAYNK